MFCFIQVPSQGTLKASYAYKLTAVLIAVDSSCNINAPEKQLCDIFTADNRYKKYHIMFCAKDGSMSFPELKPRSQLDSEHKTENESAVLYVL